MEVLDNNKRLKTKESGYEARLERANEALQRYKIRLEKVTRDLEPTRTSVFNVKEEKQASTQAVIDHKHALTIFRQTMESSNVDMVAIPHLKRMIEENEDLLKKQLGDAIGPLYKVIEDSATIGSVPDDGWVHWEGGSH